jgi:GT2 family glycosyltransferase
MKELSIVIVSWNCRDYLRECLDSLGNFRNRSDVEIIVVDNASEDGIPEMVRGRYPDVTLVETGENLGFPKGTNVGLRRSIGKYVALVNPDVRVLDQCIEKMIVYMEGHQRVGLLGPLMRAADGTPGRSYMGEPTLWNLLCRALAFDKLFPKSRLFSGFLMFHFDNTQTAEVDILNGWFWMTRKEAVELVGGLDEQLFMYADDLDWSKRFRDCGWKVVYYPEAEAIHYGGGTTARAPVRFAVEMQRANYQYWKKNYGRPSQICYLAIMALHQIVRMVGFAVRSVVPSGNREECRFKLRRSWACLQWVVGVGRFGSTSARSAIQAEGGGA